MRKEHRTAGKLAKAGAAALGLGAALVAVGPAVLANAAPAENATAPVKLTISGAGDCTLGSSSGFPSNNFNNVRKHKSASCFFRQVRPVFAKDDLFIVNLEGTLTNRGHA